MNENVALSQKKISSGKIWVKKPAKIRWETLEPDPNLLVSNGQKFWFYTPPFDGSERGQVIQKPASQAQSQLANSLLSGSFSMAQLQKIEQKSALTFLLVPKPGSAGSVSQAMIEIAPLTFLIKKGVLSHQGGNQTEISLSSIELGKELNETLFEFRLPPSTDILSP